MKRKPDIFFEAAVLYAFFALCRLLPPAKASSLGGWIGKTIGPRLAASRKALANIAEALPELDEQARHTAIKDITGQSRPRHGRIPPSGNHRPRPHHRRRP